jgi:hypothetical protein
MTAAWALTSINLALFVAFVGLALYGRYYLAIVLALMVNVVGTVYGIIFRQWYLVGINAAGALWVLWNWWKTRGRRKPVSKEIGDESRQLRDGLVRRMRRVTRRGLSPEPSQYRALHWQRPDVLPSEVAGGSEQRSTR